MKFHCFFKKFGALLLAAAVTATSCAPVLGAPRAVTKRAQRTVSAGQCVHIMNPSIGKNNVSSYTIYVTPKTSNTRFDMAAASYYVKDGKYLPTEYLYRSQRSDVVVSNKAGTFIKSSPGSNVGMLACLKVKKGSVKVRVDYKTTNYKMSMRFQEQKKNHGPLRYKKVRQGQEAYFTMTRGNLTGLPLLMSAKKGSTARRSLASASSFENYDFRPDSMYYTAYFNGKLSSKYTRSLKYLNKYSNTRFHLIRMPSRKSNWLSSAKGTVTYFYPSDYAGIKVQIK